MKKLSLFVITSLLTSYEAHASAASPMMATDEALEGRARTHCRSVVAYFRNESAHQLERTHDGLSHGSWLETPPRSILGGTVAIWASGSDGFATGTTGEAKYRCPTCAIDVVLKWNNPYVGSNTVEAYCSAPTPHTISKSGGGGENTVVNFRFS